MRRLTFLLVLCGVLGAGSAQAEVNSLQAACYDNALPSEEQVARCTEFLASEPSIADRVRALEVRGFVYFGELERFELALADYDAAVILDPDLDPQRRNRASLFFNRGRILAAPERYELAVGDFATAASINERWTDPWTWSARIKGEHLQDHAGAVADINEAVRRRPIDDRLQEMRCDVLRRANQAVPTIATCDQTEL